MIKLKGENFKILKNKIYYNIIRLYDYKIQYHKQLNVE